MARVRREMLLCCVLPVIALTAAGAGKEPRSATRYYNRDYHYCIEVPPGWVSQQAFSSNGATFAPRVWPTSSSPRPTITVGAHIDQPSDATDKPQTLQENVQFGIDALKNYGSAEGVEISGQKDAVVQGFPARVVALHYRERNSKRDWFTKDLTVLDDQGIVYFVQLKCHPKDKVSLEQVFDSSVKTLRLRCDKKDAGHP